MPSGDVRYSALAHPAEWPDYALNQSAHRVPGTLVEDLELLKIYSELSSLEKELTLLSESAFGIEILRYARNFSGLVRKCVK